MKRFNVGEVWEWYDEQLDGLGEVAQIFLVVGTDFPNSDARVMLNLVTGVLETNFPGYAPEHWTLIV